MSVTDDFNRADGGLGSNWTSTLNTPRIVSNKFAGPFFNDGAAVYTGTFPNDHYSQCVVTVDATSSDKGGPMVRAATGGNGYLLRIATDGSAAQVWSMAGGSLTMVGTVTGTWSNGDTAKLEAVGTSIKTYRNGSLTDTFTDSTYSAGSPGLYMNNGFDNKGKLDDFQATDVSGGGGTDTPLDAQPGSFAITGVAATIDRGLAAGTTSVAITGAGATLDLALSAGAGSLAVTGSAAGFDTTLGASPGSVAITGFAATLLAGGNVVLDAQPGSFAITGAAAGLDVALAAGAGSAVVTGAAAGFALTLSAAPGSVAITGFAATLVSSGATSLGRIITVAAADRSVITLAAQDRSTLTVAARG